MKKTPSISTYAMIATMLFLFNACKKDIVVNTAAPTITEVTNLMDRNTPLTIVDYGEWISIKGTNLSTTYKVDFNGTLAADSLIYGDDNTVTVKIPAQLTDLINNPITVTTKYGSATLNFQIKQPAPKFSGFDPPAGLPDNVITIKGDYFTGVTSVKFETIAATIVSNTQTEIKVKVPVGFVSGYVFITTPMGTVKSTNVFGLKATIFDDAMAPGWSNTSYSNTYDMNQTVIIRRGTKAIVNKFTVGFGAIRFTKAAPAFSTAGYTGVKISIYGGAGTAGKKVRISFTPAAGTYDLILTEGTWTDYQVPFTNLGNPASMTAITFQEFSGLASQIYVDDVGFY